MDIERQIAELIAKCPRSEQPSALCALGSERLAEDDVESARACFDRVLRLDQRFALAWVGRAQVLARLQRSGEALGCLDRALEQDAALTEALLAKADILIKIGSSAEALACYDAVTEALPDSAGPWALRAQLLAASGRDADALLSIDRALAFSDKASLWATRGDYLMKLSRQREAAASYSRATTIDPSDADVWYRLALARRDTNDRDGAKVAMDRFVALAPEDDRVPKAFDVLLQGEPLRSKRSAASPSAPRDVRAPNAARPAERSARLVPEAREERATSRRDPRAEVEIDVKVDPDVGREVSAAVTAPPPKPVEEETSEWQENERPTKKRESIELAAVSGERAYEDTVIEEVASAEALLAENRHVDALRKVERLVVDCPSNVEVWLLRARLLLVVGKADLAMKSAAEAARLDPRSVAAWKIVARTCLYGKKADRAFDGIERAYGLVQDDAEVHRLRGDCLVALGRHLEAVYAYEKAVHYAPIEARAWLSLGKVLRMMRRAPAARDALEKARDLADAARPEIAAEARDLLARLTP